MFINTKELLCDSRYNNERDKHLRPVLSNINSSTSIFAILVGSRATCKRGRGGCSIGASVVVSRNTTTGGPGKDVSSHPQLRMQMYPIEWGSCSGEINRTKIILG